MGHHNKYLTYLWRVQNIIRKKTTIPRSQQT